MILAKHYLMAHDKKLSSKDVMARRGDAREFGRGKSPECCCRWGDEGHRATVCIGMPEGHCRDGQQRRRILVTDVELLDMKLETAILRCLINKPRALDPLEVNHEGPHNEWYALCVSERNCPKPDQ